MVCMILRGGCAKGTRRVRQVLLSLSLHNPSRKTSSQITSCSFWLCFGVMPGCTQSLYLRSLLEDWGDQLGFLRSNLGRTYTRQMPFCPTLLSITQAQIMFLSLVLQHKLYQLYVQDDSGKFYYKPVVGLHILSGHIKCVS